MMSFPTEILREVGSYLSTADKASCIRVCYSWYSYFLELLYNKVRIRSRHQFRLFFRTIQESSSISDPLGDHVKELLFDYDSLGDDSKFVGITRDELESFPMYFRQLQLLEFDPRLWKYMRCSESYRQFKAIQHVPTLNRIPFFQLIIDNFGPQLTYLSISDEVFDRFASTDLLTSLWSRVPRVEKLVLKGKNYVLLDTKMLIAIGAQLPRLKHLVLSCITLRLDERDMTSFTRFPLFNSALSLILDDVHISNWRMLTFLSLAFYHVNTFEFDMTFDWLYNDDVTIETYEESINACMSFAQLSNSLKKVKFSKINTSVFPFPYEAFFQELLMTGQEDVCVEMTEQAWWSTIDPSSCFKAAVTLTGLLSKTSLKWSWTGKKKDVSLFKSLGACRHLTELHLDCDVPLRNGLRLDLLLEHCQHLENLHISHTLVTVDSIVDETPKRKHRLKKLELKEIVLADHLMDYVAGMCPKLDTLWLKDCVQEKPKKSSFIVIRLPDHDFKSIKLNSLHLNPGGPINKCEANMTILSFYESTRYANQSKRRLSRRRQWMSNHISNVNTGSNNNINRSNIPPAEMWRFYHVHKPDDCKREGHNNKQLRRLSTEETAIIANFKMNDKKWKAIRNSSKRKQYQERSLWERDIQFGAVLLLCQSVKELEFNELRV